jgi:uncharacterized phage protein (TIGR01671 family)
MREIEFRGIRKDNGEIITGYLYQSEKESWITDSKNIHLSTHKNIAWWQVIPETVGQYTGLKDLKGVKSFENDIVRIEIPPSIFWGNVLFGRIGVIKWCENRCRFIVEWEYSKNQHHVDLDCDTDFEVIGNINQHKHLLPWT